MHRNGQDRGLLRQGDIIGFGGFDTKLSVGCACHRLTPRGVHKYWNVLFLATCRLEGSARGFTSPGSSHQPSPLLFSRICAIVHSERARFRVSLNRRGRVRRSGRKRCEEIGHITMPAGTAGKCLSYLTNLIH
jgi:hypothetical protein